MNFSLITILFAITFLSFSSLSFALEQPSPSTDLSVKDFISERDFLDAELSPNGRYLAMIWSKDKIRYLVVKDLEDEKQPTIGLLGEQIVRPLMLKWASDERIIVTLIVPLEARKIAKKVNDEDFDIYDYPVTYRTISVDKNAKNPVLLTEKRGGGVLIENFLPDDPKHVLMRSYARRKYKLDKVNIYTGETEKHVFAGPHTSEVLTSRNGTPLFRIDYLSVENALEFFKYLGDDEWEQIESIDFDNDENEKIDTEGLIFVGLSEDAKLVYRKRNEKTGYFEIIKINQENKQTEVLVSLPNQDVGGLITGSRSDQIIGYTTQKDLLRKHYFDKSKQEDYDALVKQVGNNNVRLHWPVDKGSKAIAYTYGADNPGNFSIYDLESKKLNPIHDSYRKLNYQTLGIPAKVNIKMRDGKKIRAYILLPPDFQDGVARPMVVLPHGGPHARDTATYDHFAQFIATRGYIVIQPNFRGSTGYGLEFERAGYKQWGGLMQDDITDTVNFMVKQGYAKKDKICIVGASYGGYAALMGAVKTPELYQCGVSLNGVTHLKKQIEFDIKKTSKKYRDKVSEQVYEEIGHPKLDSKMLDDNSPALHADKITIPLLIMAGKKDRIVPYYQSEKMVKALENIDKNVEYHEYKWAPHNIFRFIDNREDIFEKIETFLEKHLKN